MRDSKKRNVLVVVGVGLTLTLTLSVLYLLRKHKLKTAKPKQLTKTNCKNKKSLHVLHINAKNSPQLSVHAKLKTKTQFSAAKKLLAHLKKELKNSPVLAELDKGEADKETLKNTAVGTLENTAAHKIPEVSGTDEKSETTDKKNELSNQQSFNELVIHNQKQQQLACEFQTCAGGIRGSSVSNWLRSLPAEQRVVEEEWRARLLEKVGVLGVSRVIG